jgi:AcrR family transcriptional regulator
MSEQRKHLPADERRAATVDAVISLAAEQNPSDITTAAIAQRMGLTQGAIFRHFPTKEAILQAVMSWVTERLLARVDEASRGAASPVAALEAIFMAHIDFVVRACCLVNCNARTRRCRRRWCRPSSANMANGCVG